MKSVNWDFKFNPPSPSKEIFVDEYSGSHECQDCKKRAAYIVDIDNHINPGLSQTKYYCKEDLPEEYDEYAN